MPITTNFVTTNVVSSNPAQARCTRYNIMWSSFLSVNCGRSVTSTNKTDIHDITEISLKKQPFSHLFWIVMNNESARLLLVINLGQVKYRQWYILLLHICDLTKLWYQLIYFNMAAKLLLSYYVTGLSSWFVLSSIILLDRSFWIINTSSSLTPNKGWNRFEGIVKALPISLQESECQAF